HGGPPPADRQAAGPGPPDDRLDRRLGARAARPGLGMSRSGTIARYERSRQTGTVADDAQTTQLRPWRALRSRSMIDYTLRRSDRARHTRLTIRPDGQVVVTLPSRAPERWATDMVRARAEWIDHHQARL